MPKKPQKPLTPDQVLDKMAKYCAYQERCVKDVRDKLKTFDISEEEKTKILEYLLDNRFVNDERFAMAFVRGKVNQSGGQTDEEVYRQRLIDILKTKSKTIKAETDFEKKRKLAAYAMQKGFEGSLVWEVVNGICFA